MTHVFQTLAWTAFLLAAWVALWMGISLLPTAYQPLAASAIGIAAGMMAERRRAKKAAAETAKRHKADIQEIGQAALALARDLDAANLEIKRLRDHVNA